MKERCTWISLSFSVYVNAHSVIYLFFFFSSRLWMAGALPALPKPASANCCPILVQFRMTAMMMGIQKKKKIAFLFMPIGMQTLLIFFFFFLILIYKTYLSECFVLYSLTQRKEQSEIYIIRNKKKKKKRNQTHTPCEPILEETLNLHT